MQKKIFVFSDTRYSRNWNTIDRCLQQSMTEQKRYLNSELRKFVDLMNASPEVEAVVNNGDSVDYQFCQFSSCTEIAKGLNGAHKGRNRQLFNKATNQIDRNIRHYAVSGNHDFRKEPYAYDGWGTDPSNLHARVRKKHTYHIGHGKFRGPFELTSTLVSASTLHGLPITHNLRKREVSKLSDVLSFFRETGCNTIVSPNNLLCFWLKTAHSKMSYCDLNGLHQEDSSSLTKTLGNMASNNILIFQHAQLITPRTGYKGKVVQLSIDTFHQRKCIQHLRCHTIQNSGARLLKLLYESRKNIALITLPPPKARYFLINNRYLTAQEVEATEYAYRFSQYDKISSYKVLGRCFVFCKSDCTHAADTDVAKDRVIATGPFGCMPYRIVEAILTKSMNRPQKLATASPEKQLNSIFSGMDHLPFPAIESDSKPFPQIIEARLESFLLSGRRLAEGLVNCTLPKLRLSQNKDTFKQKKNLRLQSP